MKKKLLWKLIAAFFVLLVVFSFISNAVYNAKLPIVTLTQATTMTLEEYTMAAGELYYQDDELYVRYSLSAEDRQTYQQPDAGTVSMKTIVKDAETGNESLATESRKLSGYQYTYNEETGQFDVSAAVEAPEGKLMRGEGATVELAVGIYRPYLCVVPEYCVRRDGEGEYVFVLMEQKSLFGVENYVLRVDTEIEARGGMYAALSITVAGPVIATSSLPLESGDVVVVK